MLEEYQLTSITATMLIFVAVVAGHLYKQNWKQEGPKWKYWLFGSLAGVSLLMLGFIPLDTTLY